MFERFSEKAIKAVMLAQDEAQRMEYDFVGSECLLLGLIAEGKGIAARALKDVGVSLGKARSETLKIRGIGPENVVINIPFTPRCKRIFEKASAQARELGHKYVDTSHLLLGIIAEGDAVALRVLNALGVDAVKLRKIVLGRMAFADARSVGGRL